GLEGSSCSFSKTKDQYQKRPGRKKLSGALEDSNYQVVSEKRSSDRIMALFKILVLFTVLETAYLQAMYRDVKFVGCSDTEREAMYGFDGEELFHSDFNKKEAVDTSPDFADPVGFLGFYSNSIFQIENCKTNLATLKTYLKDPDENMAPPQTSIYTKHGVDVGKENTLICHVTGFYPPPVNVSWTKNNEVVTEEINFSQYWLKTDGTFNMFSSLKFTPADGDIYSCTVKHKSIQQQPTTKIWEVDVEKTSIGSSLFCGVGLSLGLLGVAAGTVFLIKGINLKPTVIVRSVKQAEGRHPALLLCSAYDFYPEKIKVSWTRDGAEMTSDVTATMEMADGDWFYQIHSELEYTPKSGERIACVVEHASATRPMVYYWEPSHSESGRNYVIGASGLVLGLILAVAGFIFYKKKSSVLHRDLLFIECSDTEREVMYGFDGEEMYHSDFNRQTGVVTAPDFADPVSFPGFYEQSISSIEICKHNLDLAKKVYNNPDEKMAPPQTSIYTKHGVDLGKENTLICHVTGFYPPPVNISWTKNNEVVTEEISFSQYRLKTDGTFNIFSSLKFTPADGDIYSCTVKHKSIQQQPTTKTWADGLHYYMSAECLYRKSDYTDMEFIHSCSFNKDVEFQFNSSVGKYVGFTDDGKKQAEYFNKDQAYMQQVKAAVHTFCKNNAQLSDSAVRDKAIEPTVIVKSVKQGEGRHPALLLCSAYDFYPEKIKVSWTRDGAEMTSDVTATMEMADGDWFYQIHSELEYTPKSGERIACVVEHASATRPLVYYWEPSHSKSERNYVIGASGLVLGLILAVAGFIFYKKKSSGRILVPS
ncbi:hypothetical protein DNTS_003931, partial [Danionella cerebrum]